MIKSEYRRAFIMLRAAMQGYGGHARLDRRTLTGSLYFVVTAPREAGTLCAALAGQRGGEYYATPVGRLVRDRRGQLTLAWQFDPRNVGGRPLEAYAWIVVAAGSPPSVALTGNLEGSRPLSLPALERAVRDLFPSEATPAADLPETGEAPSNAQAQGAEAVDPADDVKIYTASRARAAGKAPERPAAAPAREAPVEPPAPPAPSQVASPQPQPKRGTAIAVCEADASSPRGEPEPAGEVAEAAPSEPIAETKPDAAGIPVLPTTEISGGATDQASAPSCPIGSAEPSSSRTEAAPAAPQTAAQRLGLDIARPWPGEAESLRRLFATQAPLDVPLGDGFTYVRAPMPNACGYDGCVVGLKARDGEITAVRYALPAIRTPEPPAGLERYAWRGEGSEGYWVTDENAGHAGLN